MQSIITVFDEQFSLRCSVTRLYCYAIANGNPFITLMLTISFGENQCTKNKKLELILSTKKSVYLNQRATVSQLHNQVQHQQIMSINGFILPSTDLIHEDKFMFDL